MASVRNLGDEIPDFIKGRPQLHLGNEFYLRAFYDLSRERQIGMGLGPISFFAMHAYAQLHQLDEEETNSFVYVLCRMDDAYLSSKSKST